MTGHMDHQPRTVIHVTCTPRRSSTLGTITFPFKWRQASLVSTNGKFGVNNPMDPMEQKSVMVEVSLKFLPS